MSIPGEIDENLSRLDKVPCLARSPSRAARTWRAGAQAERDSVLMASAEGLVFGPGPDAKGHAKLSAKAVADVLRRNAFERTTVLSKHFATLCETTHAAGRL
jgi:hypothetical protein